MTDMELQENYRKRLTVPSGFRNLLEGLTVEILRSNPSDIYKFAADYFKTRLDARQEVGYDDCLLGSQIDGYYRYEPSGRREELDKAATKIQSTFRGHKVRQEARSRHMTNKADQESNTEQSTNSPTGRNSFGGKDYVGKKNGSKEYSEKGYRGKEYGEREDAAATSIQAGYRGYSTRKNLKARNEAATTIQAGHRRYVVRKQQLDEKIPAISSESPKKDEKYAARTDEEEAAAIKIQAVYRGHYVRETLRDGGPRGPPVKESIGHEEENVLGGASFQPIDQQFNPVEKVTAAVKIQANYRGYHVRKNLKSKKEAATTIQAYYRGHRERKLRRVKSEAAVIIQSHYRGYRARKRLTKGKFTKSFLDVSSAQDEFSVHRDSRTSFSLPEGVKFEGNLDDDSDTEIDRMVDRMEASKGLKAIQETSSPEMADDKEDRK